MASLILPRFELPLVDDQGRVSREWYKFLSQLVSAVGPSLTTSDDLQGFQNQDSASIEASVLRTAKIALKAEAFMLFGAEDQPKSVDTTLLALWPGDSK